MKLDLTDMLYALSFALDTVETELLGIVTDHGKHVAYLSFFMGREAGFQEDELRDFVGCCILHDNAITEFIHEELSNHHMVKGSAENGVGHIDTVIKNSSHSVIGEQNIRLLPFYTNIENIILYHHENADGTGVMGKTALETNLKSQILHLADTVDMTTKLVDMSEKEFQKLCEWVQSESGKMFSVESVRLFQKSIDYEIILSLKYNGVHDALLENLKTEVRDYSDEEIHNIAELFTKIIDYKSEFTQKHSSGVSSMAEKMAKYYGFDSAKQTRFYLAGALHDIGKLVVSNDILEKPKKLTDEEFAAMKNHASATYYVLSQIEGISDIVQWASNHHEKLNGSGYPRGLDAESLSFEDCLMACIDIYQALTEKRPYKDGLSHEKTISIMLGMAQKGELNEKIVRDIDSVMSLA